MSLDPIYRSDELRALEAQAADLPLMERAGLAAAGVAREMLAGGATRVLVLAGPGNNGGDAFVVARWLKSWFFDVTVAYRGNPERLPADAAAARAAWTAAGGTTVPAYPATGDWGLIVDGLFGIGLARPIEGECAAWIGHANASSIPILALDLPSGLRADTGIALHPAIVAAATATFIALKPGLLTADGPDHCGAITTHRLDLDLEASLPARGHRVDWPSLRVALPASLARRNRNVHKGTFGTLAIAGGSDGMVGAAILAGRAALHLGAGKVWVGLTASERPAVDWLHPELMLRDANELDIGDANALVVGPGLGTTDSARALLAKLIGAAAPLVLDADALNAIATDATLAKAVAARTVATVITPHPAEAARLLATTTAAIQVDRLAAALELASNFNAAVVLKGAGSVLARADGIWAINASGNPALASGGTGDVLSGMLGALLGQGVDAWVALQLAVCLHGAAADALVAAGIGPVGVTASDLLPVARRLLNDAARANEIAPTIGS